MNNGYHQPVLVNEILAALNVHKGGRYIDATIGDGGHTQEILKTGGMVLGIDRDEEAIERSSKRLKKEIEEGRLVLMRSNFDRIGEIGEIGGIPTGLPRSAVGGPRNDHGGSGGSEGDGVLFDGILFDLGMSSGQIEGSGRGFSFMRDEPLDMRMDSDLAVTAADLVNGLGKKELASLFLRLGQVERAAATAGTIVKERRKRPIKTTRELADMVEKVSPRRGRLHPATKVFMALRMAVNDELGSLERALPQTIDLLTPGGRLAVISFHEGEDRIIKRFYRNNSSLTEINRKPITPGIDEVGENPRARSAKLRVAVRNT